MLHITDRHDGISLSKLTFNLRSDTGNSAYDRIWHNESDIIRENTAHRLDQSHDQKQSRSVVIAIFTTRRREPQRVDVRSQPIQHTVAHHNRLRGHSHGDGCRVRRRPEQCLRDGERRYWQCWKVHGNVKLCSVHRFHTR